MSTYPVYLKIEAKKYLSFVFFKKVTDSWKTFKFTSYKSVTFKNEFFADVNKDVDRILSLVFILSLHDRIFSKILEERLKPKSKNSNSTIQMLDLNPKRYSVTKEYQEIYEKYLKEVKMDIESLKNEKNLSVFTTHAKDITDLALFGIVYKNNKTLLALTTKTAEGHFVDYFEPKHILLLINNVSKPVIIQQSIKADRYTFKKYQAQIIAYIDTKKGSIEIAEGFPEYTIESKDDIAVRRSYKIDIDVLLAYYVVFNYEKKSKEQFEATLSGAEDYSNFNI